jgi:hypothetical protein
VADAQAKMSHQMREAEYSARRTVRAPWAQALARFGYACKGIVYLVMGAVAQGYHDLTPAGCPGIR